MISLDRGELRYADLRKLRGVWLATDDNEWRGSLAIKAQTRYDVDAETFRERPHRPAGRAEVHSDGSVCARRPREHAERRGVMAGTAQPVAVGVQPRR